MKSFLGTYNKGRMSCVFPISVLHTGIAEKTVESESRLPIFTRQIRCSLLID